VPGTALPSRAVSPLPAAQDHPHARAVLGAALPPTGNPSHAYLFHGPAGAGKRDAARQFAAALLADGAADEANAARRVMEGVHPDLTWVIPSGANQLLRADVDEAVVAASTHTPFESRRRVFVIEGVHTMTDEAANRMLKTLEEPPAFAHLILLTDRLGEVMPTIRSRCQAVRFEAPTVEKLAERLASRVPPEQALACARLGLGDGERALMLALGEGPALRAGAEAMARACIAQDLAGRPWTALLERAAAHGEGAQQAVDERLAASLPFLPVKEQARAKREATDAGKRAQRRARVQALDQALCLVGLWLRDVAVTVDGAPELVHHSDRVPAVAQDAERYTTAHGLRAGVQVVDETRFALREVNATEDLAVEALAFRLERVVAVR
jgi:DNA polymerase-3 subunit delta'